MPRTKQPEPTLEATDTVILDDVVKRVPTHLETGYPDNLTEEQVVAIIMFFGGKRALDKSFSVPGARARQYTREETIAINRIFSWFSIVAETPVQRKAGLRMVAGKFKVLLTFLKSSPAYITPEIHKALSEYGYNSVLKAIVTVVDKEGRVRHRVTTPKQKKNIIPLGQMDAMLWNFQNVALSKLQMIVDHITMDDVKKSNLGMKSKALRDIFSVIHMARLGNKNPNMTLFQVNVNTADSKEKLSSYSAYVTKNREG